MTSRAVGAIIDGTSAESLLVAHELKKLGVAHIEIMDWMLANPAGTEEECAAHFGYTKVAINYIKNSDIFQAKLAERQDLMFHEMATDQLTKVRTAAELSLKRLTERLESGAINNRDLISAADKMLDKIGYGAAKVTNPFLPPGAELAGRTEWVVRVPEAPRDTADWAARSGASVRPVDPVLKALEAPTSADEGGGEAAPRRKIG